MDFSILHKNLWSGFVVFLGTIGFALSCPQTELPTAKIHFNGYSDSVRQRTVDENTSVMFSGSNSHDNDLVGSPPAIQQYRWHIWKHGTSRSSIPRYTTTWHLRSHVFSSPGTYYVWLQVLDNDNEYSTSNQTEYNQITVVVANTVSAPDVENRLPEVLTDNTVILNGQVVNTGGDAPYVKIFYDTQDHGTTAGNWTHVWEPSPQTGRTGEFSSSVLGGFQEVTTYYFRCYAWNSSGSDWDDNTNQTVRPFKFMTAPGRASSPIPENGHAVDIALFNGNLEWTSGDGTEKHRVYFGTTFADVYDATTGDAHIYKGQQDGSVTSYTISETLDMDTSYYWRIDEVLYDSHNGNAARIRKGEVWSFYITLDEDGDGMCDDWEEEFGLDPNNPDDAHEDPDGDGLTNLEEFLLGTNPRNYDTDGDGIDDWWEHTFGQFFNVGEQDGLDPLKYDAHEKTVGGIPAIWWYTWWTYCNDHPDPEIYAMRNYFVPLVANAEADPDGDGLTNFQEWQNGTNPTICNADDFWIEYEYDNAGNVIQERQVHYEDDEGALVEVCFAETVSDYDNLGRQWRQRRKVNPDGAENNSLDEITLTRYYVNSSVHKSVRKGVNGTNPSAIEQTHDVIVAYTYDIFGRQQTVTDALGQVTTYAYHSCCGHLDYVTLPGTNRVIDYEYDGAGRVVATANPEGHYETRQYNSRGQVIKQMLYEDDTMAEPVMQRRMGYDNLGTLVWDALMADAGSTDPDDTAVDKVTITEVYYNDPNKLINTVSYSDVGEIVESTWSWSDIEMDASGRGLPTMIQKGFCPDDPSQPLVRQHIVYDRAGRVLERYTDHYDSRDAQTPAYVQKATMEYDAYGRLDVTKAVGHTDNPLEVLRTEYVYQGSRRIAQIDPKQLRTAFDYDTLGRMTLKTEDADGLARETVYQYDRLGNLRVLTAFDGTQTQTTTYDYDKGGNVTQITYPDTGTITYQYNDPAAGGRPTHRTDQRNITTVYIYDKLGNLLQKQNAPTNPTVVETYTYDPRGLMKTAVKVDSGITVSSIAMDYNGLGYMTQSTQTIRDGAARTIGYTRNQLGHPIEIDYPTDPTDTPLTLAYTYTSLGQVDTITRGATQLVDYSYAGSMVTGRIYPQASVTFTPEYDDFGRITRHTTVNSSNVGVDFAYEYDDNGNITQQDYLHRTSQPVNEFYYDDLNRLWKTDYGFGGGVEQFNYDLLGNRGSVVDTRAGGGTSNYTHNVANEYLTVGGIAVTHDDAGNLTGDHRGYVYEYDMENRLTKVSRSDSTVVATFAYDALGRRIETVDASAGTTTRYYYDDQRVAVQTQVSGGVETDFRHYVFGNYIDEVLVMGFRISTSWINFYYGHDHLYSPVVLYANNGTVVERYEYDAYGSVQILNSQFSILNSSQYGNPYAFTGRELDTLDAGSRTFMYYRARTYDPETGRFMQRDPLEYIDGMNLYQYVQGRPITHVDYWGLSSIEACKNSRNWELELEMSFDIWIISLAVDCKVDYGYTWTAYAKDQCKNEPSTTTSIHNWDWSYSLWPPSFWVDSSANIGNRYNEGQVTIKFESYTKKWHNWGTKTTAQGYGTADELIWVPGCCRCANVYATVNCSGTYHSNVPGKGVAAVAVATAVAYAAPASAALVATEAKKQLKRAAVFLIGGSLTE